MRLWAIHPRYLDPVGLVALWREGLLAKKVLEGKTKGYRHHPELSKFKQSDNPLVAINSYLYYVYLEARNRNYRFDYEKIDARKIIHGFIPVSPAQLEFEFSHLCGKLKKRSLQHYELLCKNKTKNIECNPLFYQMPSYFT